MAKKLKENKKLCWTGGYSDMFLAPVENGEIKLLTYEYNYGEIHSRCGGELTYCSMSGNNGEGYIERLADLVPVGLYRVDAKINEHQHEKEIAPGVTVMMPFVSHNGNSHWLGHWEGGTMKTALENYPVVIKADEGRTLIYCSFGRNMDKVLKVLLSGGSFDREPQILKKTFAKDGREEEVEVKFYNFFGYSVYPWEFEVPMLEPYRVDWQSERVHSIFHIAEVDGKYYGTSSIAGKTYATKHYGKDPCENMTEAPRGWEALDTNMMYKVREDHVLIVGWQDYKYAYEKVAKRVASRFSSAYQQALLAYLSEYMPKQKYAEYELKVNKLLFFLDKGAQMAKIHKGIAKEVRAEVFCQVRDFVEEFNDRVLLEAIPDDFVIKFEDGLEAGLYSQHWHENVIKYFHANSNILVKDMKRVLAGEDSKEEHIRYNLETVLKYVSKREGFAENSLLCEVSED